MNHCDAMAGFQSRYHASVRFSWIHTNYTVVTMKHSRQSSRSSQMIMWLIVSLMELHLGFGLATLCMVLASGSVLMTRL